VLSTAGAIRVLTYGLAQPFLGWVATRFGARQVMLGGVVLTAVSGLGMATANQPWQLYLFAGLTPGLAFAGASSVPGTVLLAGWFFARLGLATGIMSGAIPAGQSLFVPLAAGLIPSIGWRPSAAVLALAATAIALPVLLLLVREAPPTSTALTAPAPRRGPELWLLGLGYVACGFSDQFVSIHLVALASDAGLDPLVAAGFLSLLLLVGIAGSVAAGQLADRFEPRWLLAGLYLTRAVSLPLLLLAPAGVALSTFALLFGATYIANQAPGARLVRDRYGVRSVGALMGGVGLAHQVGGATGVSLGGLSVSAVGSYAPAVVACAVVALVGGVAQLLIPGRDVARSRGRQVE
jgi:MFS family permease